MQDKTEFVLAKSENIKEIATMMEDFYAIDGYPFDLEKMDYLLEKFISDTTLGMLWLVKSDEETAGYICLTIGFSFEYGGKIAVLDELYFKPEFRGKGFGKITLGFLDLQAKEKGIAAIHMEVESHNTNALNLYISSGYKTKNRKLYTKNIS
jgi:ribosomal protein S18 acetylase RimI-like enzyme